jgi:hypothetical protein
MGGSLGVEENTKKTAIQNLQKHGRRAGVNPTASVAAGSIGYFESMKFILQYAIWILVFLYLE